MASVARRPSRSPRNASKRRGIGTVADDEDEYDDYIDGDDQPLRGEKAIEWISNLAQGGLLAYEPIGVGPIAVNALEKVMKLGFALDKKA